MKRSDPLKKMEVLTNLLRSFSMKKRDRTTKGIIPYIQEHQNEMTPVSEFDDKDNLFGLDEFMEMTEKIFQYVPSDSPKMLMCVHCGDTVTIPDNCACGKIKDVYKSIERLMDDPE